MTRVETIPVRIEDVELFADDLDLLEAVRDGVPVRGRVNLALIGVRSLDVAELEALGGLPLAERERAFERRGLAALGLDESLAREGA